MHQGNVQKWVQFATALRLRLAVRVSGVKEAEAKAVIAEVLSGGKLPTENIMFGENQEWASNSSGEWKWEFNRHNYKTFVSPTLVYKMDQDQDHLYTPGEDDPRLPVLIMPNRHTMYMPVSYDDVIGQAVHDTTGATNYREFGWGGAYVAGQNIAFRRLNDDLRYNNYSHYNPGTFSFNAEPKPMFTIAELDLLKAEIALKSLGNTGGTPASHIRDAITSSTNYWYWIQTFEQLRQTDGVELTDANYDLLVPEPPEQGDIDAFADKIVASYEAGSFDEKMEIILGQKYVHLNVIHPVELYTEIRRTRYPRLATRIYGATDIAPIRERLRYPGSELASNGEQFEKGAMQEDNFTSFIFWVPDALRSVPLHERIDDHYYINFPGVPSSVQ